MPAVRSLHDRLAWLGLKLGPLVPLFPACWRSRIVRHLNGDLLIKAVGNLESRDELFWLRRQVWDLAHRILGLGDEDDRFKESGWQLALETAIANALFMPMVTYYYRARRPGVREPLDRLLNERWPDCYDRYIWSTREARQMEGNARELDRRWRTSGPSVPSRAGVLTEIGAALHRDIRGRDSDLGLVVARATSLAKRHYAPVLRALAELGVAVIWVEWEGFDEPGGRAAIQSRDHPWGLELRVPLPSPEELIARDATTVAQYAEIFDQVRGGCHCLPHPWRRFGSCVETPLPIWGHRWLAASSIARLILDSVPVKFIHVLADKDIEARAFVAEGRGRDIPSSYHYELLELGPPSYWPFSDRILVANEARAERLTQEFGIAPWRIEPVGLLEVDRVLHQLQLSPPLRDTSSVFRLALLAKWPAELFFGRPEEVRMLLEELETGGRRWSCLFRTHPRDPYDYALLERELAGRVQVIGDGYVDGVGMAQTLMSAELVVSAMSTAAFCAIAAGKPTVIYNPDPKINLGHDRLFARDDLPRHVRLVTDRDALVQLLRRVIGREEPNLLVPEPLKPSLVRYLFHSLDGRTADRIAEALLKNCEVTCRP